MNDIGQTIAAAAEALIGTPFKLHGRDPRFGLDCVGLVAQALAEAGFPAEAPAHYSLRNSDVEEHLRFAAAAGLLRATTPQQAGDILLVRPGAAQVHLLVKASTANFIHAHAALRRIVATPGPLPWPTLRHWRHKAAI